MKVYEPSKLFQVLLLLLRKNVEKKKNTSPLFLSMSLGVSGRILGIQAQVFECEWGVIIKLWSWRLPPACSEETRSVPREHQKQRALTAGGGLKPWRCLRSWWCHSLSWGVERGDHYAHWESHRGEHLTGRQQWRKEKVCELQCSAQLCRRNWSGSGISSLRGYEPKQV